MLAYGFICGVPYPSSYVPYCGRSALHVVTICRVLPRFIFDICLDLVHNPPHPPRPAPPPRRGPRAEFCSLHFSVFCTLLYDVARSTIFLQPNLDCDLVGRNSSTGACVDTRAPGAGDIEKDCVGLDLYRAAVSASDSSTSAAARSPARIAPSTCPFCASVSVPAKCTPHGAGSRSSAWP